MLCVGSIWTHYNTVTQKERELETERQRQRERDRHRETDRETVRKRKRETEGERHAERERWRVTETQGERASDQFGRNIQTVQKKKKGSNRDFICVHLWKLPTEVTKIFKRPQSPTTC